MEQSGKRSPQSKFWNIGEGGRKSGKMGVTHSMVLVPVTVLAMGASTGLVRRVRGDGYNYNYNSQS